MSEVTDPKTVRLLCGIAQSMEKLVVFRTLQGLAAAPLFPMSQVLLMSIFPAAKRSGAGIAGDGGRSWSDCRANPRGLADL